MRDLDSFSDAPSPSEPSKSSAPKADTTADTSLLPTPTPKFFRGKGGKPLAITANYLKLGVEPGKGVFEYEVRFDPRVDSRDLRFRLLNQHRETIGATKVFDGVKLYLPIQITLPGPLVSKSPLSEEEHKVSLHFKRRCGPNDRETLQLYNILFNKIMRILKFTQHNRSFFNATDAYHIPAYKLQVWPGYVTVADNYEDGLFLQCDVSHRVLRTENVRDFLMNLNKKGGNIKVEAEKALLGTSVLTSYNNKTYKIDDLDFQSSPKSTFTNEKGEKISYLDYYKKQYGIDIKDHDQPLLINRSKDKKSAHEEEIVKLICLIPELCNLTGMSDAMKADFKIMKEVGNYTRASPEKRQKSLQAFVKNIQANPEAHQQLINWGLTLPKAPLLMEARVLDPETIRFGNGYKEVVNAKGDWGRSACSKPVLTAVPLSKWALVFMDKNKTAVQNFNKIMMQQGPKMGISVANPKVVALPNDKTETYLKAMKELIDPSVQLVLAVVPAQKADRYAAIKKLCCIDKPVASQVVCLKTISNEKRLTSVVQKIVLQINSKLGGELWACLTPYKNLMVVGIDVFHDKARKSGSIAGLVASVNDSLSRYYSTAVFQKQGQEIVDCLKSAFNDALLNYFDVNHRFPDHVVVFRDGVGDGQLDMVRDYESEQFRAALSPHSKVSSDLSSGSLTSANATRLSQLVPGDYDPGFSYVVVQKRINTRIFSRPRAGVVENPPPGTVLDHTVTRFKFADFFLIPQCVNQGTVTPTHFVVVNSVNNKVMDATHIQKLAYKLTHMYYNWPGTVRVPAPCQYAHKLVDLVGEHLHKVPSPHLLDKLYYL
jgi:aubergine-like protein